MAGRLIVKLTPSAAMLVTVAPVATPMPATPMPTLSAEVVATVTTEDP